MIQNPQPIKPIKEKYKVGQPVSVIRKENKGRKKNIITGVIDNIFNHFMLIKTENYKICVMFKDILTKDTIVRNTMN